MGVKGEGSVYYDKQKKKWFAKVPVGRSPAGKTVYRKRIASSRRAASEARRGLIQERDLPLKENVRVLTFKEYGNAHMLYEAPHELRATTCGGYEYVLTKYVYPEYGHRQLDGITSSEIVNYFSRLRETCSASQVNYVRATMSRIFEGALNHKLIGDNPIRRTKRLRPRPGDRQLTKEPWSLEECRTALSACEGTPMELFVHVSVLLGTRISETLGFRWEDLDEASRTLSIRRTLIEQRGGRSPGGVKGSPVFNPPKTAQSTRTLQISESLLRAFEHHRLRQAQSRSIAGDQWVETDCVFTSSNGTPVWPSNYSAQFRRFLADNGLRHQHPHLLRHAFAQNALELGVPIESVSRALGHASLAVTLDIYAKDQRNLQNKATDKIGRYFEDKHVEPDQ